MSYGGYNPAAGQQDLPFSTTATIRSRSGSFSSIHSSPTNSGIQGHPPPQQQQQQQSPYQSPYSSQPGTPKTTNGTIGLGVHTPDTYSNNNSNGRPSGYEPGAGSNMYETYRSGASTPSSISSYQCQTPPVPIQQMQQHHPLPAYNRRNGGGGPVNGTGGPDDGGYSSGYDSSTGVSSSVPYSLNYSNNNGFNPQNQHLHQQPQAPYSPRNPYAHQQQQPLAQHQEAQQRYYHQSHSRSHSNASETSLNIDASIAARAGQYLPGPASLSSANTSRRGSMSETGGGGGGSSSNNNVMGGNMGAVMNGGGFFSRKKAFRLTSTATMAISSSDADDDLDMDLGNNNNSKNSTRRRHRKPAKRSSSKGAGGVSGSTRMGRMSGILNDWDMLLPSGDPYEDDEGNEEEDDGMNENERWKKRQLMKRGWDSPRGQGIILGILVMVAVFVRIWKLAVPSAVVFDEQHFGGFTRDYLNGSFFMDVHPPLGKMMFSLVAFLLRFDGKFDFVIGKLYTKNVPFIGMRMLAAACGVALVPVSYLIMKNSGHSTQAAIICALLVTFENALITQSRFILIDSPMMLFMGYTMLAWIKFYNYRNRPFTRGWWQWLLQTGVGLFLSSSVKWVGLFTVATVGLCVLKYLQESRTHLYISTRNFSKQFFALLLGLLVLPFMLYMGLYAIDFQLLSNSGLGDAWVSPQFRMTLKGHDVQPVMADIAWQSKIHMRHAGTNGGWVHSMPGEYVRDGTVDQAIQLVEWDDDLTCWQIDAADASIREQQSQRYLAREKNPSLSFEGYIYDGDTIRLRHCYSKVALSVYDLESIGSNKSYIREMRGIAWRAKESTPETVWKVELVPQGIIPGLADDYGMKLSTPSTEIATDGSVKTSADKDGADGAGKLNDKDPAKRWHSIKGFRLYNEKMDCYLMSHKVFRAPLSSYQEVGCIQGSRQKANTMFIVDQHVNPHLPASTSSLSYQPLSFFQKFLEVNRVMWWTHHDLSSPTHADNFHYSGTTKKKSDESQPWSWPFLNHGLNYYSSKETNNYVYLMGNPLLWWAASSTALVYMVRCLLSVLRFVRTKGKSEVRQERDRFGLTPFYAVASGTFYAGWAIHYFPFFFMDRQLYLHHYLPALYFSILLFVSRIDRTWQAWSKKFRYTAGFLLVAAVIISWHSYAPLAYGTDFNSRGACETARSLGGWEFVCQRQNLALARPQAAAAKIVVEKRSDHDDHAEQEERENSQFYYQDDRTRSRNSDPGHGHGHDEDEDSIEDGHKIDFMTEEHEYSDDDDHQHEHEDHEHDHEGPFNEDQSEHYQHGHFHHPPGQAHGHRAPDVALEREMLDRQQQGQNDRYLQDQTADHPQVEDHHSPPPPPQPSAKFSNKDHSDRAEKMMAAAAARAKDLEEKEKLLAEKKELEAKHRELEERLQAHEQEIERQRQEQEWREREPSEHQERLHAEQQHQRQRQEQEQKDREAQEQHQRQEQEHRDREAQEQQQRQEQEKRDRKEQEQQQRQEQEKRDHEAQEHQRRQEQEKRDREAQEQQQRQEQEKRDREAQEQQQRQEQEKRDREAQEQQQRQEQEKRDHEAQEQQQQQEQEQREREAQAQRDRDADELRVREELEHHQHEQNRRVQEDQERAEREEREHEDREARERHDREEREWHAHQQQEQHDRKSQEERACPVGQHRLEQHEQGCSHHDHLSGSMQDQVGNIEQGAQFAIASDQHEAKTREQLEEEVRILQEQLRVQHRDDGTHQQQQQ